MSGFWSGRRVLVTGHTGFKGGWLCSWLLGQGARVHGLALEPQADQLLFDALGLRERMDHAAVDLRDHARVRDRVADVAPEITFHMAAQPLVRRSYDAPLETWEVNLGGTIAVLDSLLALGAGERAAVIVTTDKVYADDPAVFAYRETDRLGGKDPYSASKAAVEVACTSWSHVAREAAPGLRMATARAGNVIGGGDWSADRLIPDLVRARTTGQRLRVRHPQAIRPWQHVLEPLSGYLTLAEHLMAHSAGDLAQASPPRLAAVNFGPQPQARRSVAEVLAAAERHWPGGWDVVAENGPLETSTLWLSSELARGRLDWAPRWDLDRSIGATVEWYRRVLGGESASDVTDEQIKAYEDSAPDAPGRAGEGAARAVDPR